MPSNPGARRSASAFFRFGLAVALVTAALGLTFLLQSVVSTAGFLFFYTAVVLSSWFGGKWAGWLAVVLSSLAVEYYFMAPIHSFGVNRESLPIFIEFSASALVVGWFSSWRKEAEAELQYARDELQLRVEERTAELFQTNQQLLAEMAERKRAEEAYYEA
jgi:K+-sensing histidine kinase KdpD